VPFICRYDHIKMLMVWNSYSYTIWVSFSEDDMFLSRFFQVLPVPDGSWNDPRMICKARSSDFKVLIHYENQQKVSECQIKMILFLKPEMKSFILNVSSFGDRTDTISQWNTWTQWNFVFLLHIAVSFWISETFDSFLWWRRTWKIRTSSLADHSEVISTTKWNRQYQKWIKSRDFTSGKYHLQKKSLKW